MNEFVLGGHPSKTSGLSGGGGSKKPDFAGRSCWMVPYICVQGCIYIRVYLYVGRKTVLMKK